MTQIEMNRAAYEIQYDVFAVEYHKAVAAGMNSEGC
jgi:hypothetical protein